MAMVMEPKLSAPGPLPRTVRDAQYGFTIFPCSRDGNSYWTSRLAPWFANRVHYIACTMPTLGPLGVQQLLLHSIAEREERDDARHSQEEKKMVPTMLMERTTLRDTCWWDGNLTLHWCCGTTPP